MTRQRLWRIVGFDSQQARSRRGGRTRTVVFEVPHPQGFIDGGRDQHQAAVGGKGQIPDGAGVIHQVQQQHSCNADTG